MERGGWRGGAEGGTTGGRGEGRATKVEVEDEDVEDKEEGRSTFDPSLLTVAIHQC